MMEDTNVYIGRFQPPTAGHEHIINEMKEDEVSPTVIMVTSKEDESNPIPEDLREQVLKQLGATVIKTDNPHKALKELAQSKTIKKSFSGPDRNYRDLFQSMDIHPEFIQYHNRFKGVSGTDLRNLARDNRYGVFKQLMANVPDDLQRRIFNAIRDYIPPEQIDARRKATGITAPKKPKAPPADLSELAKLIRRR